MAGVRRHEKCRFSCGNTVFIQSFLKTKMLESIDHVGLTSVLLAEDDLLEKHGIAS